MVKKTQITYLLKIIKKNGVSFFAVALIAATSIAIYLGIQSGAQAILQCAGRSYAESRLATSEITCANGITQEDIDALAKHSEVDTVEGGYRTMALIDTPDEKISVQIRSLLSEMNRPAVVEGKLPTAEHEVAIEEKFASEQGAKVGDELHIAHDGELKNSTFLITAIINDPSFSSAIVVDARGKNEVGYGSASYYLEVAPEAFDASYYEDCYTTAYVENQALNDIYFYSDEYADKEEGVLHSLESFGETRAELRYHSLSQEAADLIHEAEQQLDALRLAGAQSAAAITAYQNAQSQLDDAKNDAAQIQLKEWVVSGRNDMGDVRSIRIIVDGLFTLSYSFAFIFLLVAVVVCYAAVVKMIDDQRILIGAQKALGFQTREIFAHYLSYNVLCAVLGIGIGCICGVVIVENLVLHVFEREFVFEKIPLSFAGSNAIMIGILCLVVFILATIAGCRKALKQSAVSLLRGETPVHQKPFFFESWKGYRRLRLYSRTMIKNVLCDKGRILTTIMGIVGCVCLLIITFTLKFAVSNAPAMQFDHYYFYENRLVVNSEECEVDDFEKILEQEGISFRRIQDKLENFRVNGESWENIHVVAVESDAQIKDYIYLEDADTKEAVSIPDDGVLISKRCAKEFELEVGSVIEIMDSDGNPKECRVAGVIEHYLPYHQMVTSVDYYEEILGEKTDPCVFLLKGNIDGLPEKVKMEDGFLSLKDNSEYMVPFESINLVIIICLCFSAVLAVLVLLNQMNMYINRKAKELAVMRVNGYTRKETKAFVSKDNVVLVALGLIAGCCIGTPLAQLEVMIMETGPRRYITTPNLFACFLSAIICVVFALVINKIALRRIDHLSLTNVNGN